MEMIRRRLELADATDVWCFAGRWLSCLTLLSLTTKVALTVTAPGILVGTR
jgi:hypothetical protein